MGKNPVSVTTLTLRRTMTFRGETLLTYEIEYPMLCSPCFPACLPRINRFYARSAASFQRYCEIQLFPIAVRQFCADRGQHIPVRAYEARQTYRVTDLRACVLSLYFDRYLYTGGAHGSTVRTSQTWNLQNCRPVCLSQLAAGLPGDPSYLLARVEAQIQADPQPYFDNYRELIGKTFQPDRFYSTPDGIVLYYQQYDIAPYASGIREFLIPYSGPVADPESLCRPA